MGGGRRERSRREGGGVMGVWAVRLRVLLGGGLLALTVPACGLEGDLDRAGSRPRLRWPDVSGHDCGRLSSRSR